MKEAVPPDFYEHLLLKPYVFFDVAHGREQRGGSNGGSLRNQAILALASPPACEKPCSVHTSTHCKSVNVTQTLRITGGQSKAVVCVRGTSDYHTIHN